MFLKKNNELRSYGNVVTKGLTESIYINEFDFPGTLLFYEISLDNYDEEIISDFEW